MNKLNKNTKILLFCALAVVVNVVFGDFVSMLKIPLLFIAVSLRFIHSFLLFL